MRKENSDFKTGFVSEAGSFIDNRDYFAYIELDDMACYVIADGIDNDQEAHSAEMIAKTILENFIERPTLSRRQLRNSLHEAHEWLKFESRRVRLKASLLVVVTNYTKMIWASSGNARLYHFRGGRVNQKSKDQSLSQVMADDGFLPDETVSQHEERRNLLNYMGNPDRFQPYLSPRIPLSDGDVILLCTSGLWEQVNLPEMLDALVESKEPDALTDTLEEILLSKQQKTINNYTAVAIYTDKTYKEPPKNRKKWIKRILIVMLALLLTGGGFWIYKVREANRMAEAAANMVEFERDGDEYAADADYTKALKSYSEARNAASKVKDRVHALLIGKKQKLARILVDGDGYLKDGIYDKAVSSYTKALDDADNWKEFDEVDIQERIDRTINYERVTEEIRLGDLKFQAQDYSGALVIYKKANTSAIEVSYTAAQKDLQEKIGKVQEKLDAVRMETVNLQGDKLEQKGDRRFDAQDYSGAIDGFMEAQEKYQSIGKLERVLAMERKIAKADEKLHPIVPASVPPIDNATLGDQGGAFPFEEVTEPMEPTPQTTTKQPATTPPTDSSQHGKDIPTGVPTDVPAEGSTSTSSSPDSKEGL
ncbi:PP2C family protein-serine/threonine phosphatase [Paenibacillus glacialis]|uniref:Serine/threonine protein phosphatase n=1 Tax=Paenibacillus glacialis TaxID=494026 RepID=A0A168N7Q5_9BACL|nr:serine/threonine protein phosphatase [Paenibacillus glacialis]OAB45492.1 serine/threonine protein phosphatase [Paenibacillus glacialis]